MSPESTVFSVVARVVQANHPVCTAALEMSSGEQTEEATNAVHPTPRPPVASSWN